MKVKNTTILLAIAAFCGISYAIGSETIYTDDGRIFDVYDNGTNKQYVESYLSVRRREEEAQKQAERIIKQRQANERKDIIYMPNGPIEVPSSTPWFYE